MPFLLGSNKTDYQHNYVHKNIKFLNKIKLWLLYNRSAIALWGNWGNVIVVLLTGIKFDV